MPLETITEAQNQIKVTMHNISGRVRAEEGPICPRGWSMDQRISERQDKYENTTAFTEFSNRQQKNPSAVFSIIPEESLRMESKQIKQESPTQ